MFFDDLNWMDVESYLAQDDRVIVVTGATEQHAYLSLLTDIRIPMSLAAAVARRTNVLVAPPLNFGVSPYFMEYPGTISLSQDTFRGVVTDIINSLAAHGFKRIFVLNGHGGNDFLTGISSEFNDIRIKWHSWWKSAVAQQMIEESGHTGGHANWLENFTFTRVAESPTAPKPLVDIDLDHATDVRAALGDGSFGDAYQLADAFMQRFFDRLVDEITILVDEW